MELSQEKRHLSPTAMNLHAFLEMMRIVIPNQDRSDHIPWASFVLPAKAVHESQYGKGLWAKVPADGTTVTKSVLAGEKDGKHSWKDEKSAVPNKELKSRMEFYKEVSRGKQKGGRNCNISQKGRHSYCPIHTGRTFQEKILYFCALLRYYKERESKVMK
ncbi:hypothetical protein [Stomatobaculum longum]|uniref:hypothetical protein n=1 Tax=Stomatobaculum longum TaxID=796942 RepID=UPI002ED4FB7C